jgi:restriction system protein
MSIMSSMVPTGFERLVIELLGRLGYGSTTNDRLHVGKAGDAGIDGVISFDKLGFEKVYIQAKRVADAVSRPTLQAFVGAMRGQQGRNGVFITTASFTQEAAEYARGIEGLVLVDGQRLAELMLEHELGVQSSAVKIPRVDRNYFDL